MRLYVNTFDEYDAALGVTKYIHQIFSFGQKLSLLHKTLTERTKIKIKQYLFSIYYCNGYVMFTYSSYMQIKCLTAAQVQLTECCFTLFSVGFD